MHTHTSANGNCDWFVYRWAWIDVYNHIHYILTCTHLRYTFTYTYAHTSSNADCDWLAYRWAWTYTYNHIHNTLTYTHIQYTFIYTIYTYHVHHTYHSYALYINTHTPLRTPTVTGLCTDGLGHAYIIHTYIYSYTPYTHIYIYTHLFKCWLWLVYVQMGLDRYI